MKVYISLREMQFFVCVSVCMHVRLRVCAFAVGPQHCSALLSPNEVSQMTDYK